MPKDPRNMFAPNPIVVIALIFFAFAIGVTIQLLFFSDTDDKLREQTIYWFAIALIASMLPWVRQFKWKDIELMLQGMENKIEWLANRR